MVYVPDMCVLEHVFVGNVGTYTPTHMYVPISTQTFKKFDSFISPRPYSRLLRNGEEKSQDRFAFERFRLRPGEVAGVGQDALEAWTNSYDVAERQGLES